MSELQIRAQEVADLFRSVIAGKSKIVVSGPSWDEVYAGNFDCMIDGWKLTIFNDCGELDYVDSATAPDGRICDFDQWWEAGEGPVDCLSSQEVGEMEDILSAAPPSPSHKESQ